MHWYHLGVAPGWLWESSSNALAPCSGSVRLFKRTPKGAGFAADVANRRIKTLLQSNIALGARHQHINAESDSEGAAISLCMSDDEPRGCSGPAVMRP